MLFQSTKETIWLINESWQAKEIKTETIALVIMECDILPCHVHFLKMNAEQNPTQLCRLKAFFLNTITRKVDKGDLNDIIYLTFQKLMTIFLLRGYEMKQL